MRRIRHEFRSNNTNKLAFKSVKRKRKEEKGRRETGFIQAVIPEPPWHVPPWSSAYHIGSI
jgi:hypothetical protein